jgi:hypothetical protein
MMNLKLVGSQCVGIAAGKNAIPNPVIIIVVTAVSFIWSPLGNSHPQITPVVTDFGISKKICGG